VDLGADPVQIPVQALSGILARTTGACTVFVFNSAFLVPPDPGTNPGNPQTLLDAGPAINVKGPNGSKSMTKQRGGGYGGTFASVSTIPLPTGPVTQGGPPFLEAGAFPTDNGGGGADIGPFNITLNNPKPVVWSNMDQITTVNRAQGVTIRWTGGDPDTYVGIAGTANIVQGTVGIGGTFVCTEKATAGQFTVPSFVTLSLPAVNNSGPGNLGTLNVSTSRFQYITIPGVDLSTFITTSGAGKTVAYQ
jgi:hypothetical protein